MQVLGTKISTFSFLRLCSLIRLGLHIGRTFLSWKSSNTRTAGRIVHRNAFKLILRKQDCYKRIHRCPPLGLKMLSVERALVILVGVNCRKKSTRVERANFLTFILSIWRLIYGSNRGDCCSLSRISKKKRRKRFTSVSSIE